jgi:hypothetical protein
LAKQISSHTLPHALITAVLDAGVPLRDGQEAASHAGPRTTMRPERAQVPSTGTPLTKSPPISSAPLASTHDGRLRRMGAGDA